jgi:CRISPR/Cas system-associated exonuclease Cas4 (RecB family)
MVYIGDCVNPTLTAIDGLEKEVSLLSPRLGMSQIGHSCIRFLWYTFHWCYEKKLEKRMIRLFKRGAREEPEVYEELEKIGVIIYGKQERILAVNGHFKGKIDGVALKVLEAPKTPHLLEIKTMAHKYFTPLTKKGVKEYKPDYYAQIQIYMWKMKLKRTLFIAVNKNDDSWYIERVKVDVPFAKELERKAQHIIVEAGSPPKKPFAPSWKETFCAFLVAM